MVELILGAVTALGVAFAAWLKYRSLQLESNLTGKKNLTKTVKRQENDIRELEKKTVYNSDASNVVGFLNGLRNKD